MGHLRRAIPLMLLLNIAWAAPPAEALQTQMSQAAAAEDWGEVESTYHKLVALRGSRLPADFHVLAGVAAHNLRDIDTAIRRMSRAGRTGRAELKALRRGYGKAVLTGDGVLKAAAIPLDLRARRIYEHAVLQKIENGRYRGYLPVGVYTLGGRSFAVSPGRTIKVR